MLRTIISSADRTKTPVFLHFSKPTPETFQKNAKNLDLNKLMQNVEGEQFDYGTFTAAYDTDPRIKTMVHNFNKNGIEPKTSQTINDNNGASDETDDIGKMAKDATNLGDKL